MALKSVLGLSLPVAALALSLSACGSNEPIAPASEDTVIPDTGAKVSAADTIKEREANFKEIGKANKAIKGELDGSSPDFAAIATNATTILEDAQKIPVLFPAGTGPDSGEKTEALAAIWEKPDAFKAASDKLITAATALRSAAEAKDAAAAKAALGEVGMSCKGCHDDFREKDD